MGRNGTRNVGTVLMGIGLLLILIVAGYFAWTEVQAAQVRSELEQGSAAASARATRMALELAAPASTRVAGGAPMAGTPAAELASAKPAPTSTRSATLPASPAPSPAAPATRRATTAAPLRTPTSVPATATASPTAAPAPVLPVRLSIPDLKIDTPVVEMGWEVVQTNSGPVSQWVIPKNVAGHHLNSAGIGQGEQPGDLGPQQHLREGVHADQPGLEERWPGEGRQLHRQVGRIGRP